MDFNLKLKHAVIGASKNTSKYGFIILEHLKSLGVNVIPINPKETSILDLEVQPNIEKLTQETVLIFVVPPSLSLEITKHAIDLGFKKFWYQPGSFDDDVLKLCSKKCVEFSAGVCLLHV